MKAARYYVARVAKPVQDWRFILPEITGEGRAGIVDWGATHVVPAWMQRYRGPWISTCRLCGERDGHNAMCEGLAHDGAFYSAPRRLRTPERNTPEWDELVLSADPFEGDFGDPGDRELVNRMSVARKSGPCHICAATIQPKERVRRTVAVIDGEISTARFCNDCCHAFAIEVEDGGAATEHRYWLGERNRAGVRS